MTLAPSPAIAPVRRTSLIRRGMPADAAALAAFAARTFVETYAAHHDPDTLRRHARDVLTPSRQAADLVDPQVTVLLAFRDGALCGFAQLRAAHAPEAVAWQPAIELHRLYVDGPWHGHGVGRELLDAVCTAAIAAGACALWLNVWERNARAIAFYRKSGFVDVGSTAFYVCDDRLTDRVMVARLPMPSEMPR